MKITQLQKGYRIRLSDSEFEALAELTTRGEIEVSALPQHERDDLGPVIKRGLRTVTGRGSWSVEVRRK